MSILFFTYMRDSPPYIPRTVHERQRAAFGHVLAVRLRADPALLDRGRARIAQWMRDVASPTRSVAAWHALCACRDLDGVLEALEAATEFADEMRASHPFLGILSEADMIEIRRRVRSEP